MQNGHLKRRRVFYGESLSLHCWHTPHLSHFTLQMDGDKADQDPVGFGLSYDLLHLLQHSYGFGHDDELAQAARLIFYLVVLVY